MADAKRDSGGWGSMFGNKSDEKRAEKIEKRLREERERMKKEDEIRQKSRKKEIERQQKKREKRREDLDKKLEWTKKKKSGFHLFGDPEKKRREKMEKRRKEQARKCKERAGELAKKRREQAERMKKEQEKRRKEQAERMKKESERQAKMEKRGDDKLRKAQEKQAEKMKKESERQAKKTAKQTVTRAETKMPEGIKPKKILHDLYFSKKIDEKDATVKGIYRDMSGYEKSVEKRLEALENQTEKRIDNVERTMMMIKDIMESLRKENEELRKDRQFFVEKYKSVINENALISSEEKVLEQAEEEQEKTGSIVTSYADHGTSRNVETSMDALLELVNKKGTIRLSVAAKKLGVKEKEAEQWVHMLEEHDLIEVHYPTFGSPVLKKKGK